MVEGTVGWHNGPSILDRGPCKSRSCERRILSDGGSRDSRTSRQDEEEEVGRPAEEEGIDWNVYDGALKKICITAEWSGLLEKQPVRVDGLSGRCSLLIGDRDITRAPAGCGNGESRRRALCKYA